MQRENVSSPFTPELARQLALVADECKACGLCVKQCKFLQSHGNPREIAMGYGPDQQQLSYWCSLCHLCTAVCPFGVDPARMFLEMRREALSQGQGTFPAHRVIRNYEKRGVSPRYSYYALPEKCDTVFFPGCGLSGTRADKVIKLFHHMEKKISGLGIVLDCCTKPSHDLGNHEFFEAMFSDLQRYLLDHGVSKVIVACTNCYKVFRKYGGELHVITAYEALDEDFPVAVVRDAGPVTVHDPCAVRFEESIHLAVRSLLGKAGLEVEEMEHSRQKTICCGEGGSVGFLKPDLAETWSETRRVEAMGRTMLTYCAGCANYLNPVTPTYHLLDLLFEPEATLAGTAKVSRAPFTYLNRLKLKRYFRKNLAAAVRRERSPAMDQRGKKVGSLKRIGLLVLLVGAIVAVRARGLDEYLNQEILWVSEISG